MRLRAPLIAITFLGLLAPFLVINPANAQQTPTGTPSPVSTATASVAAPYLGILTRGADQGIEVIQVLFGSPAEMAGFQVGDLITAVNGISVVPNAALSGYLAGMSPGMNVTFTVKRGNTQQTLIAMLTERPTPTARPAGSPTAYLGVGLVNADDGVRIAKVVDGSPAAQVGLRVGDIVLNADGQAITTSGQVQALLSGKSPGQSMAVTVKRDGQPITFTITLSSETAGSAPSVIPPTASPAGVQSDESLPVANHVRLGVTYEVITEPMAKERSLPVTAGALIVDVLAGSPADRAGLKPGDIVTAVEGDKVDAKRTLAARMVPYVAGDTVTLTILRGSLTLQLPVTLVERGSA